MRTSSRNDFLFLFSLILQFLEDEVKGKSYKVIVINLLKKGKDSQKENAMSKKAALHNLGCKVNAYELEAMQQLLEEGGYEIVPFEPGADVYVINTCTVTNIADRKSRQMLHKAKKMNPDAIVVAAGCYVQAAGEELKKDESIDIVIGNNKKQNLLEILEEYQRKRATDFSNIIDINHTKEYEPLRITRTAEHTRAYLKIQDGCNQFCTYCIIPFARGRVRSRSMADVMQEVEKLAQAGYQEVVLTGIHLSSYGTDFESCEKSGDYPYGKELLKLIVAIQKTEGITRIRLGSLEPGIVTEAFAAELSGCDKVCPHFHLSMQSGCDATLKRMNRRYDTAQFADRCRILRKYFNNPALTTDIIVGFPGETEEEFAKTRAYVEQINFFETHVFKYSRRKGTKAAVMENQVPEQKKAQRSQILIELGQRHQKSYAEGFLGKEVEVLFEEKTVENGHSYWTGHTREYVKAKKESERDLTNVQRACMVSGVGEDGTLYVSDKTRQ